MALHFTSINSGSNGNCYYIGNETEAVLVDVGLTCKEVEKRMSRLGLSIEKIKAIFISHEHSDHIKGLAVFAKNTNYRSISVWPHLKVVNFRLMNKILLD